MYLGQDDKKIMAHKGDVRVNVDSKPQSDQHTLTSDFERSVGRGRYIKKITMYLSDLELRMSGTEEKSFIPVHQTLLIVNVRSMCSFSRQFIA